MALGSLPNTPEVFSLASIDRVSVRRTRGISEQFFVYGSPDPALVARESELLVVLDGTVGAEGTALQLGERIVLEDMGTGLDVTGTVQGIETWVDEPGRVRVTVRAERGSINAGLGAIELLGAPRDEGFERLGKSELFNDANPYAEPEPLRRIVDVPAIVDPKEREREYKKRQREARKRERQAKPRVAIGGIDVRAIAGEQLIAGDMVKINSEGKAERVELGGSYDLGVWDFGQKPFGFAINMDMPSFGQVLKDNTEAMEQLAQQLRDPPAKMSDARLAELYDKAAKGTLSIEDQREITQTIEAQLAAIRSQNERDYRETWAAIAGPPTEPLTASMLLDAIKSLAEKTPTYRDLRRQVDLPKYEYPRVEYTNPTELRPRATRRQDDRATVNQQQSLRAAFAQLTQAAGAAAPALRDLGKVLGQIAGSDLAAADELARSIIEDVGAASGMTRRAKPSGFYVADFDVVGYTLARGADELTDDLFERPQRRFAKDDEHV